MSELKDSEKFPFEKSDAPKSDEQVAPADPTPEKKPSVQLAPIAVSDGLMIPSTHGELVRIAQMLIDSRALPKQYETVPQVVMGMQILRQIGLPDVAALRNLAIINGSFSLWGEAPKAIADSKGLIEDFEEFWFDKDYNRICFANKNLNAEMYGALCRIKRRGYSTATERSFTVDDAKAAGLWNGKDTWKKYPKRMIQMRSRTWALKDACPDALFGIAIAEYDHNVLIEGSGQQLAIKSSTIADELNETFLEKTEAEK